MFYYWLKQAVCKFFIKYLSTIIVLYFNNIYYVLLFKLLYLIKINKFQVNNLVLFVNI